MKRYFTKLLLVLVLMLSLILVGCGETKPEPTPEDPDPHTHDFTGSWEKDDTHHWHKCSCGETDTKVAHSGGTATETEKAICEVCGQEYGDYKEPEPHECIPSDWIDEEPFTCGETGMQYTICTICETELDIREYRKKHNYVESVIKEKTCTENGQILRKCENCGDEQTITDYATGHTRGNVVVTKAPTLSSVGQREVRCAGCQMNMRTLDFANNAFLFNGKLSVDSNNLVNKNGRKVQLYGLSTHGLQWFGNVANFDTIASLTESFGINVIRFAFYTDEGGYCVGSESKKQQMLEDLKEGIDAATKLGLYCIIDWHLVGAENPADKNPLTYLEESKEFFSYISEYYKKQNNILFEIMNEPNGSTTWADCKKYAEEVIPCIRANSDGIILVGNPSWTADLNSVMKDPLVGYTNIMYTYHFYAGDHKQTGQVVRAYDSGFPVFISEFGFMNSDGNGSIDTSSGENWRNILDDRNISYVAWNISNSGGDASIFKKGTTNITDVSDENLKPWGVYLKNWYRSKSGLDK